MEKDKNNNIIQGDNFVMYNDVIIPSAPEHQFINEDLEAMENSADKSEEDISKRDSYFEGFDA